MFSRVSCFKLYAVRTLLIAFPREMMRMVHIGIIELEFGFCLTIFCAFVNKGWAINRTGDNFAEKKMGF